jgi:hypothetical protein
MLDKYLRAKDACNRAKKDYYNRFANIVATAWSTFRCSFETFASTEIGFFNLTFASTFDSQAFSVIFEPQLAGKNAFLVIVTSYNTA